MSSIGLTLEKIFTALTTISVPTVMQYILLLSLGLAVYFIITSSFKLSKTFWDWVIYLPERLKPKRIVVEDHFSYKNNSPHLKMALSIKDVQNYLNKVRKVNKKALKGIDRIVFVKKPSNMGERILASFYPDKNGERIIELYPMRWNDLREGFIIPLTDAEYMKKGYQKEEGKLLQLFILGHEIGHNLYYNKYGELNGQEIEEFCDSFSESLGITGDPESNLGKVFTMDDPILKISEL